MTDSKLIDSSVWIAYLCDGTYKEMIEGEEEIVLLSVLSLYEIEKKLRKEKIENHKISRSMDFIKKKSLLIPVTKEIAEKAVSLALQHNIPAIDSLIYASALLNNATLITFDNDFRGLMQVMIL